jgi:thiol-disulfide isomerase/thioredoxin
MPIFTSIRILAFQRFPQAIAAGLTLLAALLLLTACGSAMTDPAGSSTLPTRDTPVWSGDGWRTDLQTGDVAGDVAEATQLVLADGSTATLEELADGKPLLLYVFATWRAVCNAEFRTLTEVYPDYADDVALIAAGFGSSQTAELLNQHQANRGFSGLFAEGPDAMVRTFGVRSQSTKFGVARDGLIEWKQGYGTASGGEWVDRLAALANS